MPRILRCVPALALLGGIAAPAAAQFDQTQVSGTALAPFTMTKTNGATFQSLPGVTYDIYKRLPGDDFRCLAPDLPANTWTGDPASPVRAVWFYTVNAFNGFEENRHGSSIPIAQACHAPVPLTVTKTPQPASVASGETAEFTIEIDNRANPSALVNCSLVDDVDAGGCMTLTSCGAVTPPIAGLTCDTVQSQIAASGFGVAAGSAQTLVFTVTAGNTTGPCTNSVTVTCGARSGNADGTIDIGAPSNCNPVAGRNLRVVQVVATTFSNPIYLTAPPGDSSRLFVVEKPGRIRIIKAGAVLPVAFLDIQGRVFDGASNEQGLLSMAFHPQYASNGKFYVYYTAPRPNDMGGSVLTIEEYQVSAGDPDVADPTPRPVITIDHPSNGNHNGGQLAFSPNDGYLYLATGDGGGANDGPDNAENLRIMLGKVLRIDVNVGPGCPAPYCVPADNPFVGNPNALPEIWAYGLRNPWRFSFDRTTGDLYIGDVGQGRREEIDVAPGTSPGGEHWGWDSMEGTLCHEIPMCTAGDPAPNPVGILPTLEYDRGQGSAVVGGFVYRGCHLTDMVGTYFYADNGSSRVWSFEWVGGAAINQMQWTGFTNVNLINGPGGFGQDADGELYILNHGNGRVYRISD